MMKTYTVSLLSLIVGQETDGFRECKIIMVLCVYLQYTQSLLTFVLIGSRPTPIRLYRTVYYAAVAFLRHV